MNGVGEIPETLLIGVEDHTWPVRIFTSDAAAIDWAEGKGTTDAGWTASHRHVFRVRLVDGEELVPTQPVDRTLIPKAEVAAS